MDSKDKPSVPPPAAHIKLPRNADNQQGVQFTVFCQKRRQSTQTENPQADDSEIENLLLDQWNQLDEQTRRRFIPMGSDVTHFSQLMTTADNNGTISDLFCSVKC